MWSELETVAYRLPDGHIFEYTIDHRIGITTGDIDRLACSYFEHTGNLPETVFIRTDLCVKYVNSMVSIQRYTAPNMSNGINHMSMWTSIGQVPVKTNDDAYIPLLIGSQKDYDDNNVNWLFEEIVLRDCERE